MSRLPTFLRRAAFVLGIVVFTLLVADVWRPWLLFWTLPSTLLGQHTMNNSFLFPMEEHSNTLLQAPLYVHNKPLRNTALAAVREWKHEALKRDRYLKCDASGGHGNVQVHWANCMLVALVSHRIVVDYINVIPNNHSADALAYYYDIHEIPYASGWTMRAADPSITLTDPLVLAGGDVEAFFGDHRVVKFSRIEGSFLFSHFLYMNPRYRTKLLTAFQLNPIGWLFNIAMHPQPTLLAAIRDFYATEIVPYWTLAVHIRWAHGTEGYYTDGLPHAVATSAACVARVLAAELDLHRKRGDARPVRIFLACDNDRTRRIFADWFPGQFVHQAQQATPDHANKNSVIFDEWIMSLADAFVGTYPSSITFIAAARSLRTSYFNTNARRCVNPGTPEGYFASARVIGAFPYEMMQPLYMSLNGSYPMEWHRFMAEFGIDFDPIHV